MEDQFDSCKEDLGRVTTLLAIRGSENKKLKNEVEDLRRRLEGASRAQQVTPLPVAPQSADLTIRIPARGYLCWSVHGCFGPASNLVTSHLTDLIFALREKALTETTATRRRHWQSKLLISTSCQKINRQRTRYGLQQCPWSLSGSRMFQSCSCDWM